MAIDDHTDTYLVFLGRGLGPPPRFGGGGGPPPGPEPDTLASAMLDSAGSILFGGLQARVSRAGIHDMSVTTPV